jgi:hypothetical protein
MRCGLSKPRLVARAVDVNVALKRIDLAAAIESGLESFEPEDAICDRGARPARPGVTEHFPIFEHGADWPAATRLYGNAMKAKRRAIRIFFLPNPEA